MRIPLSHTALAALALAIGSSGFSSGNSAPAVDVCAGQSWPNYSRSCLENTSGMTVGLPDRSDNIEVRLVSLDRK